jgi:hypothetical protein
MLFRFIFYIGLAAITACTPGRMASDPRLEADSDQYRVTERPVAFSGGDLVFGPYRATRINRSFVSKTSDSTLGFTSNKVEQDFRYHFKGQGSWKAACIVESGNLEYKVVSGGFFADIHCKFVPLDNKTNSTTELMFDIGGETSGTARGKFTIGSHTIEVAANHSVEGTSLRLSQHSGYYFYLDGNPVAGVDTIAVEGPVWLNRTLTADEKDAIGLVVVALLLNST